MTLEPYFGDQYKSMQNTGLDTFFYAIHYSIKHEEVEVDDESISVINIYNENEELIYQNNDDLNYVHRVYIFDDEKIYIWLSAWGNTNFYVGPLNEGIYIDGYLGNGMLLAVDTNTGEELYKLKTDKNEIFLTVNDNKAYFYHQGYTENQGMLWWEEDKNAKIFYRDLDDFDTKHIVYTFGYDASMYNESINVEEIVGLDIRFLEQGTFVTEKFNDNLEFNISEDNISIKFNYSLIKESVGSDYTLPLWEVNIPFADDLEVTSEHNDLTIKYDDETYTYDERVIDKGIIGYVYFGENCPVEIIEVSCFYDSDVMSDEEIVSELEEMIKSIEFH